MWIVIGLHQGDLEQAKSLVAWMHQLDGKTTHGCLLCSDPAVEWGEIHDLLGVANQTFQRVEVFSPEVSVGSWPAGANFLFKGAAQYLQSRRISYWFWCEPDCIPLKKHWMDALESAYKEAKKPFLGTIMTARELDLPLKYLPGCSVYPWNAWSLMEKDWDETKAFDMATASVTVPLAADTDLIHHFWGPSRDLAPTFVEKIQPDSPVNAWTLHNINPKAVVFHRNKDLSLMKLLGYQGKPSADDKFVVLFPFFNGDGELAAKLMEWIVDLGTPKTHEVILSYEHNTKQAIVNRISAAAQYAFSKVSLFGYQPFMHGPNVAWVMAARHMFHVGKPWLWMEPDAIPLKPHWLETLQGRYSRCGQPFMGPFVPGASHCNGTAVYPPETAAICKNAMNTRDPCGFDVIMAPDMMHLCHNCGDIYFHCWGEVNGRLDPRGGEPPDFGKESLFRQIPKDAVIMHRSKNGRLIDRLRRK